MSAKDFPPFKWRLDNAESLTAPSESVDYVVVHAGLHHMSSPHRALTEMYRVARKGIAVFESRDSFVMRLLERLQLTQTYEHQTVFERDLPSGGVNNTEIPNYIFRWTEREIEKTISAYAPTSKHSFQYRYRAALPSTSLGRARNACIALVRPIYALFSACCPKQRNLFAVFVEKPQGALHPWLSQTSEGVRLNREWGARRYLKAIAAESSTRVRAR